MLSGALNSILNDKTLYIPAMDPEGARLLAAAFRCCGISAEAMPPSDERTRDSRDRHTAGDECHPFQVIAGDVMKLLEGGAVDPARSVFFLPASNCACRFNRFVPDLRAILDASGFTDTGIFSPNLESAESLVALGREVLRTAWRALIAGDIVRKLLLIHRPFETEKGTTDKLYETAIQKLCLAIESAPIDASIQFQTLSTALNEIRESFLTLALKEDRSAPTVGVVGELFCCFNPLINEDLILQLEHHGAQVRVVGLAEEFKTFVSNIPDAIEELNIDEQRLNQPFREAFPEWDGSDNEKINLSRIAKSYLPSEDGFGPVSRRLEQIKMMAKQNADAVMDFSPFPCMYGSACASFFPKLSADLGEFPIVEVYFTGAKQDWNWLLEKALVQAKKYRSGGGRRRGRR